MKFRNDQHGQMESHSLLLTSCLQAEERTVNPDLVRCADAIEEAHRIYLDFQTQWLATAGRRDHNPGNCNAAVSSSLTKVVEAVKALVMIPVFVGVDARFKYGAFKRWMADADLHPALHDVLGQLAIQMALDIEFWPD